MSNKTIYYERFNDKLDEFFKDIIIAFPNIAEFKEFKSGLTLLRNVNVKAPQNIFNNYVSIKFKNAILARDENIFLNNDDFGVISNHKDYWNDFINYLKKLWGSIEQSNKDIIWTYLHVLYILSEKCLGH